MKIPWSKPNISDEEKDAVNKILNSGWVSQGPETKKFEQELAQYIGCKYAVVVNNGTSAIIAALLAHDVKKAIIPGYTFPATKNALMAAGANFIFADIDPQTIQMLPQKDDVAIQIPVSYAGMPLYKNEWSDIKIIEDAAESFGAISNGKHTGNQGWTACFSFHIAKLITTIEGGAIVTNDKEIYENLLAIRQHGEDINSKGVFIKRGLNLKTTDINSAIGRVQLSKIEAHLKNRENVAKIYRESLENCVRFQNIPEHVTRHSNMMFPIFVDDPITLSLKLKQKNIDTRLSWPMLLHTWAIKKVNQSLITLPIYNDMKEEEVVYVVQCVKESL